MRDLRSIIVHCSATAANMDIGAEIIKDWHMQRGWSDIGYHYVIRRSGLIEPGRPLSREGAHVKGHNEDTIGICLIGGIDYLGVSDFNYTFNQMASLRTLVEALREKYGIMSVYGHRELDSRKECPCFDVGSMFR